MPVSGATVTFYVIHSITIVAFAETPELAVALDDLLRPFAVDNKDTERHRTPASLTIRLSARLLPGASPPGATVWLDYGPLRSTVAGTTRYLEYKSHLVSRYLPEESCIEAGVPPVWGLSAWMVGHAILFPMLVEALRERGFFLLHAAALATQGRVAIFPAESGSGKTTLTLALLRGGFALLSDDAPSLRQEGVRVVVYGFPEPLNVTRRTSTFFPEVTAHWHEDAADDRGKVPLDGMALYGGRAVPSGRPGAVIFPTISNGDRTTLAPLAKSEALLRLVALAMPAATHRLVHEQFELFAALVAQTPCYTMGTGRDLAALPDLIGRLLRRECAYTATADTDEA